MTTYNTGKMTIIQLAGILLLGTLSCYYPVLVTAVWIAIFLVTIYAAVVGNVDWIWYAIAASPILEVWSRMIKAAVILDEIGKYFLLVAIVGIAVHHIRERAHTALYRTGIILLVLLAPGLVVALAGFDREQWVFNVLPVLELGILLFFVARERWDVERFARTLQFGLMPVFFVAIYLAIKTPGFDSLNFALSANFKAAGGGTNQVATILGLGIVYAMLLLLLKRPVMWKWLMYLLIGFLFFRSFLTFSRGGVFAAVASVLVALFFALITSRRAFIRYSLLLLLFTAVAYFAFDKVDEITGRKLSLRYQGETIATVSGEQEKTWSKVTSGRTTLVAADWYIFKDNWLFGVGPGAAKTLRNSYGGPPDSAAHTEFTRLMSEHGIGGLLSSLLLLLFPFYWVSRQRYRLWKGVSASLFCIAILTASHSAMRTNTTVVCYALASVPVFIVKRRNEH